MRRKEKQLPIETCHEILEKAEWWTLATRGEDDYPYAVPLNYVYLNGSIYFHCAKTGHKMDHMGHCANVSFNVVTDVFVLPLISENKPDIPDGTLNGYDTYLNSVTVFGKVKEVFDQEKMDGLMALFKNFLTEENYLKYKEAGIQYIEKSFNRTQLMKIEIHHMTGKKGIK